MSNVQQKRIKKILKHIGKAHMFAHVVKNPFLWKDLLSLYPEVA